MPSPSTRRSTALLLSLGALSLSAGMTGCLSFNRELSREEQRQSGAWEKRLACNHPRENIGLTWEQALVRLRAGNRKLRAADIDCLRAEENARQVGRSLIPLLNVQAGYNRALEGGAGIDPFTFATSVFFDVPGLVGYRMREEAAKLVLIRTDLARQLVWREQVVELYRRFQRCASLADELAGVRQAAEKSGALEPFRTQLARQRETLATDLARAEEELRDVLGAPDLSFRCATSSLPAPGFDAPSSRPAPATLARLPLRLSAVELVGLHARELGLSLEAWPELSVYISNPSVYRHAGDSETYWSSQDVFLGANINWSPDTRGRRASQRRIHAAEAALRREALEQESLRLARRAESALAALTESDAALAALPATAGSATLDAALAARRRALAAERLECQLVLWFFDDSRWPSVPPLPDRAAP